MKKIALYCLQLLAIVGVASLTSCGGSDTVTPVGTPTIKTENGATYTTKKFEKGEVVKVKVTAEIPGGAQIFQVWRKVGTGAATDVSSTYSAQFPASGATTYTKTFDITVAETFNTTTPAENNVVFTFRVRNSSMTAGTFIEATYSYEVVAQGQGGGGGVAPLLRASATVTLGAQGSSTPSYAISVALTTGTSNGLYSTSQVQTLSASAKKSIDLTFGVLNASGNAATGADATAPSLISPSVRKTKGFTDVFDNDVNASVTTFKATSLTSLSAVTATNVNNNIDHSSGTSSAVTIEQNKVYSFVNAQGKKGYILIKTLTGTQDTRDAQIDVLVQQ